MPNGLNSNGSSITIILELIRLFSKFYESYESVIKYDILFVLTSAGSLNYEGTQKFINKLDASISENLHYVLCLDSLALKDSELNIHLSRFPKSNEETAHKLYKVFNTTAENMNFNLNYIKKKVFLTNKIVPWEHEQFSKKKILSGTISGTKIPSTNNFNKTLLIDNNVDFVNLKKNTKFLAESFLSFLFDYDIKNFTIFRDDENLIDDLNIETIVNYMRKISRFPLNIQKGSSFNNYLFNYMNMYLTKTQRQNFDYNDLKFYDTNSGFIRVYTVKSKLIDLYLLVLILFYLLLTFIYTRVIFFSLILIFYIFFSLFLYIGI
jgi:hypothetical protein